MRQRRLKYLDERLENVSDILDRDGKGNKGVWRQVTGKEKLFLEIGCGKGQFACTHAQDEPKSCFVAVEGQLNAVVRAAEKVKAKEIDNVYLIASYIHDIREYFEEGELDGIYLNFSDPWPKAKHEKRRLTYRENLRAYMQVLKPEGFIEFKTDNDEFFEFSVEEVKALEYNIQEFTRDLESENFSSKFFKTEYEERFLAMGKKINYMRIGRIR